MKYVLIILVSLLIVGCCPKPEIIREVVVDKQIVYQPQQLDDSLDAMWWDGYAYGKKTKDTASTYGYFYGESKKDSLKVTFDPNKKKFWIKYVPRDTVIRFTDTVKVPQYIEQETKTSATALLIAIGCGIIFGVLVCVFLRSK